MEIELTDSLIKFMHKQSKKNLTIEKETRKYC